MEPGAEGGGLGLGTVLAGAAGVMFVGYVWYKVSKKREELHATIELLSGVHEAFVSDLEALVESAELIPAAIGAGASGE